MKTSDKLYNINRQLSTQCFFAKKELSLKQMEHLNKLLAEIIKEIRELEK